MPRVFKVQDILDGFEGLALRTILYFHSLRLYQAYAKRRTFLETNQTLIWVELN